MTTNEKSISQGPIWNNMEKASKPLTRQNVLVKTRKKVNIVVEQSSLSQIELKMMQTNIYFLYETCANTIELLHQPRFLLDNLAT